MVHFTTGASEEAVLRAINVAQGKEAADVLLTGGRVVNVFTGEIEEVDVCLAGAVIAAVGKGDWQANMRIDLGGRFLLPGLIEAHIHLESTLMAPGEFARLTAPHGTTTLIADPHEIANVAGLPGIDYMLRASENLPVDMFFMAPSCVPATDQETSGAEITASDIKGLLARSRILGLAEMMNFPGVLSEFPIVIEKLRQAWQARAVIDGHAPGLKGRELNAYISAGIGSDHESFIPDEALEKVRRGMRVMVRDGSAARNLNDLIPVLKDLDDRYLCFSSDDLLPTDLRRDGEVDGMLRKAVAAGADPVKASRMATINAADWFGLRDRGAIGPGKLADLVVVNTLTDFHVEQVFKSGRLIARDGELLTDTPTTDPGDLIGPLNVKDLTRDRLAVPAGQTVHVIDLIPGQIVTGRSTATLPDANIAKLAVIERHKGTGNIGLGFVRGFGLQRGALASTVAHDSHNIIVVGMDDGDCLAAAEHLIRIGGGFVAAAGGKVLTDVPLPIGGLMSNLPYGEVCDRLEKIWRVSKELGCALEDPFMILSFLALPVIPTLKLTDRGLFDVEQFRHIPLEV